MQALVLAIERGESDIFAYGARGTGKTIGISDYFLREALGCPMMTQLWLRTDRVALNKTVLKTFEDEVLSFHPFDFGKMNRENRPSYLIPNGSEIILSGFKSVQDVKSFSGDAVWWNEPNDTLEELWEAASSGSRPRIGTTAKNRFKIGDVNPTYPNHWIEGRCKPIPRDLYPRVLDDGTRMAEWLTPQMYFDIQKYNLEPLEKPFKSKRIIFCMADNPGYWSLDPWGWKPGGLEYVVKQLGPMSPANRARFLEGRAVPDEGTVFGESFDVDRNTCDPFLLGWDADWPVWIGYDPGYAHPCAVVFYGVAPNGQPFIIDEIHGSEIDLDMLGPMIKNKASKYRIVKWLDDSRGANQRRQESNGKTVRDIMRERHRLFFQPWQAAEGTGKQAQVEAVRLLLVDKEKPLKVWNTCRGVIGEFQSWAYARTADGRLKSGDERYEDRNNDAMDAVMGIIADNPRFTQLQLASVEHGVR